MGHTQGPWTIAYETKGGEPCDDGVRIDSPAGPVAYRVIDCSANLIAAAPELLDVARWVRDNMEPLGKDPSDGIGGWRHMDATEVDSIVSGVLHFCDEAIAKAEGTSDVKD